MKIPLLLLFFLFFQFTTHSWSLIGQPEIQPDLPSRQIFKNDDAVSARDNVGRHVALQRHHLALGDVIRVRFDAAVVVVAADAHDVEDAAWPEGIVQTQWGHGGHRHARDGDSY